MPKESVMESYIKSKARKHEIIDYDVINGNFKRCEFCKKLYHPSGLYKHKVYCKFNPDRKIGYKNQRKWKCRFCNLLFKHNKERNLHEGRCSKNSKVIIIISRTSNKDRLELCRREFPDVYNILTLKQIRQFLDNDKDNKIAHIKLN
ncbi:hypothetical protein LCGC14_1076060 [marine sediment metagenome]|uniref:Uncharacterized protein n=1 Tax=marine sediment metagenome TaxID=412755 RepID=A0A0F9PZT7_9ZZZZ